MVSANVYANTPLKGKVRSIAVKTDQSMKYNVEVELSNNSKTPIKAGMYGSATFEFNGEEEVLTLSREAIIGGLKNPKVYRVKDGKATLQSVEIGQVMGDKVEVFSLKEGNKVVVNGQINLKEGTAVTIL